MKTYPFTLPRPCVDGLATGQLVHIYSAAASTSILMGKVV